MRRMSKLLIILGLLMVAYTMAARISGMPAITDFMPVSWFGDQSGGAEYYRIVGSDSGGAYWLFALAAGIVISAVGLVLKFIK